MAIDTIVSAATSTGSSEAKTTPTTTQAQIKISKIDAIIELKNLYDEVAKNHKLDDSCNALIGFDIDLSVGFFRKAYQFFGGASRTGGKDNLDSALKSSIENILNAYVKQERGFDNKVGEVEHFAAYVIGDTYGKMINTYKNSERDRLTQITALIAICRRFQSYQFAATNMLRMPIKFPDDFKDGCLQEVIDALDQRRIQLERNNKFNTLRDNMTTLGDQAEELLRAYRFILLHMTFGESIPFDLLDNPGQLAAFQNSELNFDVFKKTYCKKTAKKLLTEERFDFIRRACFAPSVTKIAEITNAVHQKKINALREQIAFHCEKPTSQAVVDVDVGKQIDNYINKIAVKQYFGSEEFLQQVQKYKKVLAANNKLIDITLEKALPKPFQGIDAAIHKMEEEYRKSNKPGISAATAELKKLKTFLTTLADAYKLIPRLMNLKEEIHSANVLIAQFGNFSKPMLLEQFQEVINAIRKIKGKIEILLDQVTRLSDQLILTNKALKGSRWAANAATAKTSILGLQNIYNKMTECLNALDNTLSNEAIADDMFEALKAVAELVTRQSFDGIITGVSDLAISVPISIGYRAQLGTIQNQQLAQEIDRINTQCFSSNGTPLIGNRHAPLAWKPAEVNASLDSSEAQLLQKNLGIPTEMKRYNPNESFSYQVLNFKWWYIPLWFTGVGLAVHLVLAVVAAMYRLANRTQIVNDLKTYKDVLDVQASIRESSNAMISTTKIVTSLAKPVEIKAENKEEVSMSLDHFLDNNYVAVNDVKPANNIGKDVSAVAIAKHSLIKRDSLSQIDSKQQEIISHLTAALSEVIIEDPLPKDLEIKLIAKIENKWEELKAHYQTNKIEKINLFKEALSDLENKFDSFSKSTENLQKIKNALPGFNKIMLLEQDIKSAVLGAVAGDRPIMGAIKDVIKPLVASYPALSEINSLVLKALKNFLDIIKTANRSDATLKALESINNAKDKTQAALTELIQAYTASNTCSTRRVSY